MFERAHDALSDGGAFVNADQASSESPQAEESYREWWLGRVREAGVGEKELAAALERIRADKNATLKAQLAWMRDAGFRDIACDYENKRFVVYRGRKAGRKLSTERTDV